MRNSDPVPEKGSPSEGEPMKLVIFRHGLAMDREEAFQKKIEDGKRPLVEKGKEKTKKVARFLKAQEEDFEVLLYSPLLRARETAQILQEILGIKKSIEVMELVPDAPPEAFAKWLQSSIPQVTKVIVVGHEPQLSSFATWCLSGARETFFDLKKSGAIGLEIESFSEISSGTAELKWLLHPKMV